MSYRPFDIELFNSKNGLKKEYGNVNNIANNATIIERNVAGNYLVYTKAGTGNTWITSPIFYPTGSHKVIISFDVVFSSKPTGGGIQIYVSQNVGVGTPYESIINVEADGHYDIEFDPAYYTVYEGYTSFCIWFSNKTMTSGQTLTYTLSNLSIYENVGELSLVNFEGGDTKSIISSIDTAFTDVVAEASKPFTAINPSGIKYELAVNNSGTIVALPIVPTKAAFIGNSLLTGFGGYGMASSEPSKDYYNRINEYILDLNPSYTSATIAGGTWEGSTTEGELNTNTTTIINALAGDETLVVIQLGDNVNTVDKNTIFNTLGCKKLLTDVRIKCPNARVFWMGMWYGDTTRYTTIQRETLATGCKFVSLSGMNVTINNSAIGNKTNHPTSASRTLTGVTNVVENTATNITVTFTVSAISYNTTLDVTSYSLISGTLTYASTYEIISTSGVASHPGDEGFRKIANKFLFESNISDIEESIV